MGLLSTDDIFYDQINDKRVIEEWIKSNYNIYGDLTISDDFVVNCAGEVNVNNKSITSLTNDLFRWGKVDGMFNCSSCENITTLEGSPKIVGGSFYCGSCKNLTSLEGAPEKVCGGFSCSRCDKLTSLEGAPKEVGKNFYCSYCDNLISLEGAPKVVGDDFLCHCCNNLKTLKGGPEKVGKDFNCIMCNNLRTLKGAPEVVRGLACYNCKNLTITDSDRKKYKICNLS